MEEKYVRSRLYHHLANRRNDATTNLWSVDDFLSHALAILYPYVRDKVIDKEDKLVLLCEAIRTFRKVKDELSFLDSLTELSLVDAIRDRWICRIENKKELAESLVIVDSVTDDGLIMVKAKLFQSYLTINVPADEMVYGECEYRAKVPDEDLGTADGMVPDDVDLQAGSDEVLDDLITINANKGRKKQADTFSSDEEMAFKEMWSAEGLPTALTEGHFFWEYKISSRQYVKIRNGLLSLHFEKRDGKFIRRYGFYISLFLAEWFKREYDGNQNDSERGLSIINVSSNHSKHIWEGAKLPECYLVNLGVNLYLYSIYVLGGFPIFYINRVRRFDSLFNSIWTLRQGEDLDEDVLDNISETLDSKNSVYQVSLSNGGSLYAYIDSLLGDDIPLSDEDKPVGIFKSYCNLLNDGKRACYDNYLSCTWNIYTDGHSEQVDSLVNVKVGSKKNRCYIPRDCVERWLGVVPNEFLLGLETDNGRKSQGAIRFSLSGKSYVGWGDSTSLSMMFDIQTTHEIRAMVYDIDDVRRENGRLVQKSFTVPDYMQLYQTDTPYKWSSARDFKAHSAVFFNSLKYKVNDGKEYEKYLLPATLGKPAWVWVRLYDLVTLIDVDTDDEVAFNLKQGALNVLFNKHKGLMYNQYEEVSHSFTLEDDTLQMESLPLFLGPKGIRKVKLFPFEENESPKNIGERDYKVFFKQNERNFRQFDDENQPEFGTFQLKITYKEYRPIVKKCFYIPQDEIFRRNVSAKTITFYNSDIIVWKPNEDDTYELMQPGGNSIFSNDDYKRGEDVIPFRIGTETDFISLDIFRADDCKEIYFNNSFLAPLKKKFIDIPLIIKSRFSIRTIDDNGVKRVEPGRNVLLDHHFITGKGKLMNVEYRDEEEELRYYLYIDKGNSILGRSALNIFEGQKDNYRFYYWSGKATESPRLLETPFVDNCLRIPVDVVNEKNEGIIFQSLKDSVPPNYVFPYYSNKTNWQILTNKLYRDDVMIKALRIATEHNVYFSQFYPLHKVLGENDNGRGLVELIVSYLRLYNKRQDILALHRFADEFLLSWILLPVNLWRNACRYDEDRDNVEKLFRADPHIDSPIERTSLDLLLDKYWNLPAPVRWNFQRNKSLENIALQSMRDKNGDSSFFIRINKQGVITKPTFTIETLYEIHQSDDFYRNLYRLVCDKITNN